MKTYITELLNSNSRLIVPDFGAFIVKQKNPKIIVFNEFLKYNDGLLIDYIVAKEKIEKEAAKDKVTEFVKDIRNILNNNEEVLFEGVGKLAKDPTGKIILFKEGEVVEKKEVKKEKPQRKEKNVTEFEIVNEVNDDKKEKPVKEKNDLESPKVVAKAQIEKKKVETTEKEVKEAKKEEFEVKPEVKAEPIQEKPEVKAEPVQQPVQQKPEIRKETVTIKKPEPEKIKIQERPRGPVSNKKAGTQYVLWILLILLVNGLILGWFVFNDRISNVFKKSRNEVIISKNIDSDNEATEALNTEEAIKEETLNVPENLSDKQQSLSTPVANVNSEKKYYIVAGCFKDLNNANSLVNELKSKGYKSEKFGRIGSLHAVSYDSFIDKNAATVKLREIRQAEKKDAWIIFY